MTSLTSFLLNWATITCSLFISIDATNIFLPPIIKSPVVPVCEGKLQGSVNLLLDGVTNYYSFKGIPYALPPLGNLRFKAPLPPKAWTGILDATEHRSMCIQKNQYTNLVVGSEDCLHLNVYTKTLDSNAKLPVMFYIHGGGYSSGSGNSYTYGPEYLLLDDVIVVTINYRLEVLGFLCLDMPDAPGNPGMKDQVAALKWVRNNIAQFGGDPDNVTIFGISSGSASVTYHLLSHMSKNLFHRAIAQSGTCLNYWAQARNYVERAFRVGKYLGKECKTKDELLEFLLSVPAEKLAGMNDLTKTDDECHVDAPFFFVPVVEKEFKGIESFIYEDPLHILLKGKANKVPLMIGYQSAEGLYMFNELTLNAKNNDMKYLVPREIAEQVSQEKAEEYGERIFKFYIGGALFNEFNAEAYVNLLTDTNFFFDAHRFASYYSAKVGAPVFAYRFDYDTLLNIIKIQKGHKDMKGSCHADDIYYIFKNNENILYYNICKEKRDIIIKITELWTDLARTGNPTPNCTGIQWDTYNSGHEYMNLREPMCMSTNLDNARIQFLDQLYCDAGISCLCA